MPQNKVIDSIDAADTFDELKQHQILIDTMLEIFRNSGNVDVSNKIYYLLSIYEEKMRDVLPKFEKIIKV